MKHIYGPIVSPQPTIPASPYLHLQLAHIRLERAGRCLLSDLSLTLYAGEALLLTGPNGTGKTSLLRLMAGLCPPQHGALTYRAPYAWLGPDNALKPSLTLEQNLRLFTPYKLEVVLHALDQLALAPLWDCPVRLLSLGQKRRAAFARLLLAKAPLWLLDEPANALDASSLALMESLVAAHRAQGGSLVIASHTPVALPGHHSLSFTPPTPLSAAPLSADTSPPEASMCSPCESGAPYSHPFLAHLRREAILILQNGANSLTALIFLLLCGALFPLALGPEPALLRHIGPGVLWVCSLLACLLSLEPLYISDAEDGSLDLLHTTLSPALIAFGKIISHWLSTGLPIVVCTPLYALLFHLSWSQLPIIMTSLALGSLTLSLIGGMVAAIALGARRNSLLLPILALPLMSPSLIFGTLACTESSSALISANLSLLAAQCLLALPFCPLLAGLGLKDSLR